MKILKLIGKGMSSPVFLGLMFTLLFAYTSWQFLILTNKGDVGDKNSSGLFQVLWEVHQKSIDFRLRSRKARPGTDQVALLTVDEKAVSGIGRWPWPREYIASLIDRSAQYGAKVIGFDAIFAESSDNQAYRIFEKVKEKISVNKEIEKTFSDEIAAANSDQLLAESISRNADKTVLGVFFDAEYESSSLPGYIERCQYLLFQRSRPFKMWEKEESFLEVHYPDPPPFPAALVDVYNQHFDQIANDIKASFPKPKNRKEEVELELAIKREQSKYCQTFLDPEQDPLYQPLAENWAALIADESNDQIPFQSFEEWVQNLKNQSPEFSVPIADDWVMNTDLISSGAKHTAFFNADQDPDGTIRKKRLFMRTGLSFFPSLALKTYLVAFNSNAKIVLKYDPTFGHHVVSELTITDSETGHDLFSIPVDQNGKLTINYAGPQKMFPYLSAADILSDSPEATIEQRVYDPETKRWREKTFTVKKAEFLKNRLLIFGATAKGIYDLRVTPFDENYPGAETHVTLLDNLIRKDFLATDPREELQLPLILLGLGAIVTLGLAQLGAISGLMFTAGLLITLLAADRIFYFNKGVITTISLPLALVVLLYILMTFYRYFTEERGKRELRSTFQKYVSPSIVNEILSDPTNLELGGRKMTLTVFFSDVRGFTTISEKLDPRALTDLLNSYLTPMTEIVFRNRGTLDKYMGDAIMAFFGAPIAYDTHAQSACRCALQSVEELKKLQEEYKSKGLPIIDLGIGLNTGEVNVGNMGSQTVRNYTVMGDAVNLGSRLEGINKEYGTRIVISEFTYALVKDQFICRELDRVRVKGKLQPIKIYELMAEGKIPDPLSIFLAYYNSGYQSYYERKFTESLMSFKKAQESLPDDKVCELYIHRCEEYLSSPPPAEWDGVYVMKTK